MTGQMASEGTSRGRQRPSHHLKACLRGFQMVYRAHILCEELKLKIVATSKNFEAVRPLFQSEAAWGHSSDLKPPRPPYMILKWLALTSGYQMPRIEKEVVQPQKFLRWLLFLILALHTKYEPCRPSGTLSNRLFNDKMASNGLKNSLKVMFEANSRISMKKWKFWPP